MSEKYTLSSLLSRLSEFESTLSQIYDELSRETADRELKHMLTEYASKSKVRANELESIKEFVIELALEPITGIELNSYINRIKETASKKDISVRDRVKEIELNIKELYSQISSKIKHISGEASYLLDRYVKEASERISKL